MSAQWNASAKRWYIDGKPVHAGDHAQLRGVELRPKGDGNESAEPGEWFGVRIESRNAGRDLDAYVDVAGLSFRRHVAGFDVEGEPWAWEGLRWAPEGARVLNRFDAAINARNQLLQAASCLLADALAQDDVVAEVKAGREPGNWWELADKLLQRIKSLPGWRGA